jgi:hypothetical protein
MVERRQFSLTALCAMCCLLLIALCCGCAGEGTRPSATVKDFMQAERVQP